MYSNVNLVLHKICRPCRFPRNTVARHLGWAQCGLVLGRMLLHLPQQGEPWIPPLEIQPRLVRRGRHDQLRCRGPGGSPVFAPRFWHGQIQQGDTDHSQVGLALYAPGRVGDGHFGGPPNGAQ